MLQYEDLDLLSYFLGISVEQNMKNICSIRDNIRKIYGLKSRYRSIRIVWF